MKTVLKIMNNELNTLKIPYTFDGWDKEIDLPQFIGEISEVPALDEDGMSEYSFILTGYALKNNIDYLFNVAEILKKQYKPSKTINGVVIIYDNFIQIDTNNDELKQIQINLKIKKWSV